MFFLQLTRKERKKAKRKQLQTTEQTPHRIHHGKTENTKHQTSFSARFLVSSKFFTHAPISSWSPFSFFCSSSRRSTNHFCIKKLILYRIITGERGKHLCIRILFLVTQIAQATMPKVKNFRSWLGQARGSTMSQPKISLKHVQTNVAKMHWNYYKNLNWDGQKRLTETFSATALDERLW